MRTLPNNTVNLSYKSLWSLCFILCIFISTNVQAQDIEPRRWGVIPIGTNVIGVGYLYSNGELLLDPVLEVEDVEMNIHSIAVAYVKPFNLLNTKMRFDLQLPFASANWNGLVSGQPASADRTGMADPRLRLSYSIIGPPSASVKEYGEFLKNNPVYTTVGVSLSFRLPFGNYLEDKLLNIGFNRFTVRPQIGMVHNWNKWSYEITGSIFLFTKNKAFANGNTRTQAPMYAFQNHLNYQFNSSIWTSIGIAYGAGGKSKINDISKNDLRQDLLFGYSLGFKIRPKQSIKFSYLRSATQQTLGARVNTFALLWIVSFN
jgi:hypothetical protein